MPVVRVVSGDTWIVSAIFTAEDGSPALPANSFIEFVLAENQFSPPLWTGEWVNGILPDANRPGLVHIRIPREVTKALRRGSYMFSARVADRMRSSFVTQLVGNFLVEYMPTSDQHSIPYRDGTSEIFGSGSDKEQGQGSGGDEPHYYTDLMVKNKDTGLYHRLIAVNSERPDGSVVRMQLDQQGQKVKV